MNKSRRSCASGFLPSPTLVASLTLGGLIAAAALGCRPPSAIYVDGTGGSSSSGGSNGSGGPSSSGGSKGSGGSASGGVASGGSSASGGVTATGGTAPGGATGSGGDGSADGAVSDVSAIDGPVACTVPRGPMPKVTGTNFPFPQNRPNTRCVYPLDYCNGDVRAAYEQWKTDTVTAQGAPAGRRVKRPAEPGLEKDSTVSEGIAYGMLIAVYMNDQTLFDDLWKYEQKFLHETGLMHWYIKADGSGTGSNPDGRGPATDADEDMGFALLMADKQWGGAGTLGKSYLEIAKDQIGKVYANEIFQYKFVKPGAWGDNNATNLSYFAPAFYRLFAKVDTPNKDNWMMVIETMYGVLAASLNAANGNQANGLVPAWCNAAGQPNGGAFGANGPAPTHYQYDSCRTPFRIGMDWCWNGEKRAQSYVTLTSNFFSGIGAAKIVDGYDLNGKEHPEFQTGDSAAVQSAAFLGPAGVGAMNDAKYQSFVNDAYSAVATRKLIVGGTYYDESWMVMSLLMMTGNFLDYTTF